MQKNSVLVIEGIHALNPELTSIIEDCYKYRIYVSVLTSISLDNHNWIPTTDNRLLRRIIRDYRFRGYSARDTIARWPSVRRGEDKWIFPYQENADAMFNSAMLYELAALRKEAEPILGEVRECDPENAEAYRLLVSSVTLITSPMSGFRALPFCVSSSEAAVPILICNNGMLSLGGIKVTYL